MHKRVKHFLLAFVLSAAIGGISAAQAALYRVDISPPGTDHAVGLGAPNAVAQPSSLASGDVIGDGITYDDVSNELKWSFAYGSDFGFVDLVGDFSVAHLHGPVEVQFPSPNTGAGVLIDLGPSHVAGSSAKTGSFIGSSILSDANEANLLASLMYINIHTSFEGGGEIRGQLVPSVVPLPAAAWLLLAPLAGMFGLRRPAR